MQVTTNLAFVTRRRRLGRFATLFGFLCLIGGLVITWVMPDLVYVAYLTLLPGYILISIGGHNTIRWGTKPRIDEAIATALKTLDHRYHLFNYIKGLPADNLLLTPNSLVVLEIRPYMGQFRNTGSRWRRKLDLLGVFMSFTEGGLGNPTRDALRRVADMKRFLADALGQEAERIPVESIVVFTHPRATLAVEDPEVPVAHVKELRGAVRPPERRDRIPANLNRRLVKLLKLPQGS